MTDGILFVFIAILFVAMIAVAGIVSTKRAAIECFEKTQNEGCLK